jgi:hypothetical protein
MKDLKASAPRPGPCKRKCKGLEHGFTTGSASRAPGPWLSCGASGCRDPSAAIPHSRCAWSGSRRTASRYARL